MKNLTQYINEYLIKKKLDKVRSGKTEILYTAKNQKELINVIKDIFIKDKEEVYNPETTTFEYNLNCIDISNITDLSYLTWSLYIEKSHNNFPDINDVNIDVSEWDVSNVTNMRDAFSDLQNFNCDLSNWDISKVKNTCGMFRKCKKFEGKGLENWDVSKVENMNGMFSYCNDFDCDLSNWKLDSIKDMRSMFFNCSNFEGKGLNDWNIPGDVRLEHMFKNSAVKDYPYWWHYE